MIRTIGISGPSCSGKTTLSERLAKHLNGVVLSQDDYWVSSMKLDDGETMERLECYRMGNMGSDLKALSRGETVIAPYYVKNRQSKEWKLTTQILSTTECVIAEGFLIYCNYDITSRCYPRIFLDIPEDVLMQRRLERDGKDKEEYIKKFVIPDYKIYLPEILDRATHKVNANRPLDEVEKDLLRIVEESRI